MKKIFALLLALSLMLALAASASAAGVEDKAVQTVRALGIMVGDEKGNMNLSANVTRAQFAKMMAAASVYKDTLGEGGSGYSLYKDVKSSYWASEYIRLAAEQGWMIGYVDGTFRPDNPVALEEACTATLRLLGYTAADLAGTFPAAQLNKAASLGLRDQLVSRQGEAMTRRDCAVFFYNLLTAKNYRDQVYATTLGYTVKNDEVDYTSVTKNNLNGPYISDGSAKLPFVPTTVYRNGKTASSAAMSLYDVYYYNEGLGTVWIYTGRASGKITALTPSSTAPTSVSVSGVNYAIGSADATYQLSVLGGGSVGSYVTLLLGMDDAVVGVVTGDAMEMLYYGVVRSCEKEMVSDGGAAVQYSVKVFCTDGVVRTYGVDTTSSYSAGSLVSVSVTDGGVSLRTLSTGYGKKLSGYVNTAGTALGSYLFAPDVRILDVSAEGDAVKIDPARIAGCSLSASQVRYYTLNTAGEIENLILGDVTGDTWTYAYLTKLDDNSRETATNVTYTYVVGGRISTLRPDNGRTYPVSVGGIALRTAGDGTVRMMNNLNSAALTELGTKTAMAGSVKYALAEDVQVYLRQSGAVYLTELSAVNTEDYVLTGWYDSFGCPAGGQIRIITAYEK